MTRNASDHANVDQPLVAAVDLFGLLQGMWRRKLLMLLVIFCVVGLAATYIRLATPKYTATAEVMVENTESAFMRPSLDTQPRQLDERDIASQVQVMRSREIAERVVSALGLTSRPEFRVEEGDLSSIKKWMIEKGLASDPTKLAPERLASEIYLDDLQVYPIVGTKVISVTFASTNPEIAAEVANAVANEYVDLTREAQSVSTSKATEWLAEQIEQLREKVLSSERAVETYRAEAGLLQGSQSTLSTESLTELNNQIIQAAGQRAEAQARADSIRQILETSGRLDSSFEVLNSPLMQRLIEREVTLRGSRDDLLATLLPSHPRIAAINSELAGLQAQIRQEALKIAEGQEQQAQIAEAREAALTRALNDMKTQASKANDAEVKLRALEREAAANRTLLETFLTRYSDASARENAQAQPSMARVISPATVPLEPSSPKAIPLMLLAIFGGIILALVVAFIAEIFSLDIQRNTASPRGARGTELRLTHQASITDHRKESASEESSPALIEPQPQSVPDLRRVQGGDAAESAVAAIAPILADWQKGGVKRLMLGSTSDSPIAISSIVEIARAMAHRQERVILLDLDADGSRAATLFGAASGRGLSELLAGKASFSDTIKVDQKSNLHVIGGGSDRSLLASLLESGRMGFVLNALSQAYDVIVLMPGRLQVNSFPAISANGGVIVATGEETDQLKDLVQSLQLRGIRELAVVDMAGAPEQAENSAAA